MVGLRLVGGKLVGGIQQVIIHINGCHSRLFVINLKHKYGKKNNLGKIENVGVEFLEQKQYVNINIFALK